MIKAELVTTEDLKNLKEELVSEIRDLLKNSTESVDWVKSSEVKKILNCSEGTLVNWRTTGLLPCSKVKGTFYYRKSDLNRVFERHALHTA